MAIPWQNGFAAPLLSIAGTSSLLISWPEVPRMTLSFAEMF
jgi:hypothetical protein